MKKKPTYAELEARIKLLEQKCAWNKKNEEKLVEQFDFLQTLIDTIPLPIFYKDINGKYSGCNVSFQNFIKKSKSEIIGKTVMEMGPEEICKKYLEKDLELMRRPGTQVYEWKVEDKNGELKYVVFNKATYCDKNDRVCGIIGAITDITRQKAAEKKIIEYQNRLRSLSSELLIIEERERRIIADELHDSIGQTLAALKIKLGILNEPLLFHSHGNELSDINKLIDGMIKNLRSMIFEISPPILYKIGLEAAVEWLIEKIQETSSIECSLVCEKSLNIKNDQLLIFLFRAIRELLINILKHAFAQKVRIIFKSNASQIAIEIIDDGIGFDYSNQQASPPLFQSYGLFSIQERMATLGGAITIKTAPGKGTKVKLTIPQKTMASVPPLS